MTNSTFNRRHFLGTAASALTLASLPKMANAATTYVRLEWQQFKLTPQYTSFLTAVRTMKANPNANDPNSWQYWANVHMNYCPHRQPYFLAWHRGYIFYLERQLRIVSGDNYLNLPYWDYYTNPNLPSEFTDTATGNPLYMPRLNTNVYSSLDLSPFAATTVNFQRGTVNSFEEKFETAPHNPVHNILGNVMATMQSPMDPIFYLHHCNVDRLWHAWALPAGGTMPVPAADYWAGSFTYATGLTMLKGQTYSPRSRLGYDYANTARPLIMPPQAQRGRIIRVQAQVGQIRLRPQIVALTATPARTLAAGRRSVGGVSSVQLTEDSISTRIVAPASAASAVQEALTTTQTVLEAATISPLAQSRALAATPASKFKSVKIVLDDVSITKAGLAGGYFYNVYLNLPAAGDIDEARSQHFLGTLGPFEVAGLAHHGSVTLDYPATEALLNMGGNVSEYVVSLVRVNGPTAPKGKVMRIGEMRVELSTDAPYTVNQILPRTPGDAY